MLHCFEGGLGEGNGLGEGHLHQIPHAGSATDNVVIAACIAGGHVDSILNLNIGQNLLNSMHHFNVLLALILMQTVHASDMRSA